MWVDQVIVQSVWQREELWTLTQNIYSSCAAVCGSSLVCVRLCRKDWGIESFVSSTLLRNMREKDLRKAISYHMKKILVQEPKQKVSVGVILSSGKLLLPFFMFIN